MMKRSISTQEGVETLSEDPVEGHQAFSVEVILECD